MKQLALPLGTVAGAADDLFLVSDSNAAAIEMLENWREWPVRAALLVGPAKSGRSLLARIFAAHHGARVIDDARDIPEAEIFHAWNAAQAGGGPLLIVADAPPPQWDIGLPDLRSRMMATPLLRIGPPDDALIALLLRRHLDARHLPAGDEVIDWIARRAERSHGALLRIAEILSEEADARGVRRLSIPSVRATLNGIGLCSELPGQGLQERS